MVVISEFYTERYHLESPDKGCSAVAQQDYSE